MTGSLAGGGGKQGMLTPHEFAEHGARGGKARAANLSHERRSEIARKAARARWNAREAAVESPAPLPTPLLEIDPRQIRVTPVPSAEMVALQRRMSRATWRPFGRRLPFKIEHESRLLGIVLLASPVISLAVRDRAFNFPGPGEVDAEGLRRGTVLRRYADMSICVAAQPIGWHWNLGKLCAMLATTFGDFWTRAYGDPLIGVFTTSLWGRSSQYNRIYRYLGLTKGFGHEHVSDAEYQRMLRWMRRHGVEIQGTGLGDGSNSRMRRIMAYRRASGDRTASDFHGRQRGVYYCAARPPGQRDLVIREWHDRWGLPRYLRTRGQAPPYQSGLEAQGGAA